MPATPENVFSVHPFARTGLHIVSVPYRACGQCVKRAFPATRRRRLPPPARPKHASCFQPNIRSDAFGFAVLPKEQKTRQQKLLSGTKSWTLRCHPALTRHRCRTHSSTANTVRLLTRALRPRLLVAFRLGPPGPILSGSVPAGITPPPTLSQSVSRFLPVNGLLSCFYAITAFPRCQRIFAAFLKFSARTAPQRSPGAHPLALVRTLNYCCAAPSDKFFPARFTQMPSAPAQAPFPRTSARAVRKRCPQAPRI